MPPKERFRRAPIGARLERCPLVEISTFRSEQQPRLREMIFVKVLVDSFSRFDFSDLRRVAP